MDICARHENMREQRLISNLYLRAGEAHQYINKMEKSYVEIDSSFMKESIHEQLNANMEKQRQKRSPLSMTE